MNENRNNDQSQHSLANSNWIIANPMHQDYFNTLKNAGNTRRGQGNITGLINDNKKILLQIKQDHPNIAYQ